MSDTDKYTNVEGFAYTDLEEPIILSQEAWDALVKALGK